MVSRTPVQCNAIIHSSHVKREDIEVLRFSFHCIEFLSDHIVSSMCFCHCATFECIIKVQKGMAFIAPLP